MLFVVEWALVFLVLFGVQVVVSSIVKLARRSDLATPVLIGSIYVGGLCVSVGLFCILVNLFGL